MNGAGDIRPSCRRPAAAMAPPRCRVLAAFNFLPLWLPCTWDASQQDATGLHDDRVRYTIMVGGAARRQLLHGRIKQDGFLRQVETDVHGIHGKALDHAVRAARVTRRRLDAQGQRNMQTYAGGDRRRRAVRDGMPAKEQVDDGRRRKRYHKVISCSAVLCAARQIKVKVTNCASEGNDHRLSIVYTETCKRKGQFGIST